MRYPTQADWTTWEVAEELHRSFILLWDEILGEDTLDSWQVRTSNARTILDEIIEVTHVAASYPDAGHNLQPLIAELGIVASIDPVIDRYPHFTDCVQGLKQASEVKEEARLDFVRRHAVVARGLLDGYGLRCVHDLRKLLLQTGSREKDRLRRLVMSWATHLVAEGYSLKHLRAAGEELVQAGRPFIERFDALVEGCAGESAEMAVSFIASWPTALLGASYEILDVRFERRPPTPRSPAEEQLFKFADANDAVASTTVKALDVFGARRVADARFDAATSILRFYQPAREFNRKGKIAAVSVAGRAPEIVEEDDSRRRGHLRDTQALPDNVATLARLQRVLSTRDLDVIESCLQHHRLSISATTDEARLVNMWIALESLVRHGHGSIIERICRYVPPTLAIGNAEKLLRGLAGYLRRLRRAAPRESAEIFVEDKAVTTERLLHILREPKGGEAIDGLYRMIGEHLVVRHRVHHLREKVFKHPTDLADNIERHDRNIDWQLRRIYRARNHVTHRGGSPRAVRHLLQHLYTYFTTTFTTVLEDVDAHPGWSLADAFEHRRMVYELFVRTLRDPAKARRLTFDVVLQPHRLFLGGDSTEFVWPEQETQSSAPGGDSSLKSTSGSGSARMG